METKSIFLKNVFYMEATHLLPLFNLKLFILQIPNPLTRESTHQPISSTCQPFKLPILQTPNPLTCESTQLIQKPKIQIVDPKQKLIRPNLFYDQTQKIKNQL